MRTLVERTVLPSGSGLAVASFAVYAAHVLFGLGGSGTNDVFDHWLYARHPGRRRALCLLRAVSAARRSGLAGC